MSNLWQSYFVIFGYAFNIFNLLFPEAFYLATKGQLGWLPKRFCIIIIGISLLVPFGWLFLLFVYIALRFIINESDALLKDEIKIFIKE